MSDAGDEPEGSYAIYFAEGEILAKQGLYTKAIDSYTKALDIQENDKSCLVARSKCYLKVGNTTLALQDAEDALKENKLYHKGLYQKAEVLYSMGDFEHALMFYHRGRKIRPELHEFTLGIQKAQEAINNSIGTPQACKLEKIGDLTFFQQQENVGKKKLKKLLKPGGVVTQQKKERKPVASEKTIKELLGEMYADREYLDKLMADPNLVLGSKDRSIYKTVESALVYLDARTEFWRQQKPMYTRNREKQLKLYKPSPTVPIGLREGKGTHTKLVLKSLENIDTALAEGNAEGSLRMAEKLMNTVASLTDSDLPGKREFMASLHSCLGNAHLELGEAELAMDHYLKELAIAENLDQDEMLSRALDNVGRVFAVMGKFRRASEFWMRKLSLVGSPEESAWLHHELGRCQLELCDYNDAVKFGRKSLDAAIEAHDQMWQLNAFMLIAQAQSRLSELSGAMDMFDKALELARVLEDEATEASVVKAMEDVKEKIKASMQQTKGEGGAEMEAVKEEEEEQAKEGDKEGGQEGDIEGAKEEAEGKGEQEAEKQEQEAELEVEKVEQEAGKEPEEVEKGEQEAGLEKGEQEVERVKEEADVEEASDKAEKGEQEVERVKEEADVEEASDKAEKEEEDTETS